MMQIKLRDFANLGEDMILRWRGTRMRCEVTDDYGEKLRTDTYTLMLSWYGMCVHRLYNEYEYSIDEVIQTQVFNDESLAQPLNNFLPRVMATMYDPVETDRVKRVIFTWQTQLNNFLVVLSEKYAVSATAESVAEMMDDEGIAEIKRRVVDREITIDEGEIEFIKYVKESPTLNFNIFALLARTGGVQFNQAYQTVICRGAVFDLNNQIFPNPIYDAYAEGIVNLADSLGESRGAGKSLNTNGKALKDSEWFHRKTHLFMAVVRGVEHLHDCGSPHSVPIKLTGKDMAMALQGKYQVLDDGSLRLLTNAVCKTLVPGDTVNIRSIAFCLNHDAGKPCRVCYGQMKAHLPYNVIMKKDANIGMFSGTTLCNPIGQGMLSTKHFLRNTTTQPFVVAHTDKEVITTNGDDIFLQPELCKAGTELILPATVTRELTDLRSLDSLENVGTDKLSYFTDVIIKYMVEDIMMGGETEHQKSVVTSVSSRTARMSTDFLEYVLENGWESRDKKFITIDLAGWHAKSPLFTLPYMHEDLNVHRSRIESFLTFSKRNNAWKKQAVTPRLFGETLAEFWSLINQKFRGNNIIHTEVMLFATTAKAPEGRSYALVNGRGEKYFTSFINCINNRGMGTLLIFERQQGVINDPRTFLMRERQESPLEAFWHVGMS